MKIETKQTPSSGATGVPESQESTLDTGEPPEPAATENPEQPGLQLPDNAVNLVPYLLEYAESDAPDAEEVRKFIRDDLPDQIIRHFEEDDRNREGKMRKEAEITKLLLGDLEPKKEPFANCANMHEPILLVSMLRLVSRVHSTIFAPGQPIARAQLNTSTEAEREDAITRSENWQFSKEIPDFQAQSWRYLWSFFCYGEGIFDSYRDFVHGVNRHEFLSSDDFVYPYIRSSVAPDMSDVPRKTRVRHPYKRDLKDMERLGFYAQVDKVVAESGSHDTGRDEPVKDVVDKAEGRSRSDHTYDAPYEILEQHTWTTLPGSKEDVPVVAVVSRKHRVVLALYSRYIPDEMDRSRFNQQTAEFEQYIAAMERYSQELEIHQQSLQAEGMLLDRLQQPDVPPDESQQIAGAVQRERPPAPVEPSRPPWLQDDENGTPKPPEPIKQKVLERFSRGTCIDIPNSSYGIGIGTALLPHQMAANIMLNQYIDASTQAISNTAVMSDAVKFPKGVTTINPNEVITVRGIPPARQLSDYFFRFDHQPPNPQLLQGVQQQKAAADAISSAPDVLSGVKEGDETFRGMATRVEQATKQLAALTAKAMVPLTQVFKNNAALNFQFMPEIPKTVDTRDPASGKVVPIQVSRELYRDSYEVIFAADLSFASRATKVSEADDAMGLILKGIPPKLLPMVFELQGVARALAKCFHARGMHDMAAYVLGDNEVAMRLAKAQMEPPPGGPQPGGPNAPSIPNGQTARPPGAPPQHQIPVGTPAAGAQEQR
jgi:hypothetical protein